MLQGTPLGGLCGPSARFVQEMHGFVPSRAENSGFCNGKWASAGWSGAVLPRVTSHFVQQFVLVGEYKGSIRDFWWVTLR